MDLTEFIWKQFPEYYHKEDSYKDAQNRGLLERFLYIFGVELQQETIPKLEKLIDELNPETAANQYLSEIAYSVGRPNDILEEIPDYRTLLTQIISIYKIKGTSKSYELFFALLGMKAKVVEYFPLDNIYDNGLLYDQSGDDAIFYDDTACEVGCVDYSIEYKNLPGKLIAPLTPELEAKIKLMIEDLLEPIDCKLRALVFNNDI